MSVTGVNDVLRHDSVRHFGIRGDRHNTLRMPPVRFVWPAEPMAGRLDRLGLEEQHARIDA